jgi:predicted small metal-binding protein
MPASNKNEGMKIPMKKISDRDLGIDCDYEATGNTDEEVMRNETTHLREKHPDELSRVKSAMKTSIKEA